MPSLRQGQGWAAPPSSSLLSPCPHPLHPPFWLPPVLDGLGLTAAVAHNLGDVLGLAPGTLVREQSQLVDGWWRGQQHGGEDSPHQDPKHHAHGLSSPRTEHRLRVRPAGLRRPGRGGQRRYEHLALDT